MTGHAPVTPDYMRAWGTHAHGSPLYRHLVEVIAEDHELIRVINRIEHRPPPNVLFAAVQYLLMKGADPDLASFYASLTDDPEPSAEVDATFAGFVLSHEEEIVEIGHTRYTQTNECRRCVVLLPGVMEAPFHRFHLIDLGTSTGLNLAIDRYHYRWDDLEWGPKSSVVLEAESRGVNPRLHDIEVLSRIGLDLNPVDPTEPDQRMWLDALIWPEHASRRERLREALGLVRGIPIQMVAGDALVTLADVLAGLPAGEPAVVMNSFVLMQFTVEQREQLEEIVGSARTGRPIHRVSMEVLIKADSWARLSVDDGSGMREVGQAHPHGEWVELYARP